MVKTIRVIGFRIPSVEAVTHLIEMSVNYHLDLIEFAFVVNQDELGSDVKLVG